MTALKSGWPIDGCRLCPSPSRQPMLMLPCASSHVVDMEDAVDRLRSGLEGACKEIPGADLRYYGKVGGGSYSIVFAGKWRGQSVAIKSYRSNDDEYAYERQWQMFLSEVNILHKLEHPRIIQLLGACVDLRGCPSLVMELAEGGNLHDFLHNRQRSSFDRLQPCHRFLLAIHIAEGIEYLHTRAPPVAHRDVKSRNVVVMADKSGSGPPKGAKLIDVGLAEHFETVISPNVQDGPRGSAGYMAPECFVPDAQLQLGPDIWALGCVLAEIFGGAPPHAECQTAGEVAAKLVDSRLQPDVPPHADIAGGEPADNAIRCLLTDCFALQVSDRPVAAEVVVSLRCTAERRGFNPNPP